MIETPIRVKADLDKGIRKTFLDTLFVTNDNAAHRFEIEIVRGDAPVTLSGTVNAYFIRYCDNATILVDGGTVSGNVAKVTLKKQCYNRNTQFALIVKVATASETATVFYGEGAMHIGSTDTYYDEENVIPSLDDLLAKIDAMETATANANTAASKANTAAGRSPYIGTNGHWYVWNGDTATDTGISAQGPQGAQGPAGTIDNVTITSIDGLSEALAGKLDTTGTAANAQKLGGKTLAQIMLEIYPVGSIYTSTAATSPASLFGGTWTQLKDRFLLGAGDTYAAGTEGGSAEKTLTANQMPKHTHGLGYVEASVAKGTDYARLDSAHTQTSSTLIKSAGEGEAFDIMPPYLAVYMWKRVS